MEDPCKIIFFGDSITKGYTPILTKMLEAEYPERKIVTINAGIGGETSRDGLRRIKPLLDEYPQVIVIGFGLNDWRKGVARKEFKKNILQMVEMFEGIGSRVILNTLSPCIEGNKKESMRHVDEYSALIREISLGKKIKIADINALWKRKIFPVQVGLRDQLHPNAVGYNLICESLMHVVPRQNTTVLWQYNSREAKCNYRCPYCYYTALWNPKDMFFGTMEQWHAGFKKSFGNQHLILYLAFGEPSIGSAFFDILEMVASEPNWELRMTSNASGPVEQIGKSQLAREGRLHINTSFHPLSVSREDFLKNILVLRENGIEVPVVYVAYPPFLKRMEDDIKFFDQYGFVVHVRRFQGRYKGGEYPYLYTDVEKQLIAKYMDDGSIRYMLNQQHNKGDLTYSGLYFFVADNVGNMGYDSNLFLPYTKYRCIFGNIHQENFRPLFEPGPYPGKREGTVDGVANLIKAKYHELEKNNVLSFMRQGGVYKTGSGVFYKNKHTDFNNSQIRAEYNFPPRNLKDISYYATKKSAALSFKILKNYYFKSIPSGPLAKKILTKIRS